MGQDDRRVALDTSVIVAALLGAHEHHALAGPFVATCRTSSELILPLPALIESYSVLTRLPLPLRLERTAVRDALRQTFRGHCRIVALNGEGGWDLLDHAVTGETTGGAVYDLHIATCALSGAATHLATFNRRHFERFNLADIVIVVPGSAGRR